MEHVTHLRMAKAAALLESTPMKIAAVAEAVGYANPFAFSTAFRRAHGAWLNAEPLHASTDPMDDSSRLMLTSNLLNKQGRVPGYAIRWLGQTNWKLRILGSAALEAVQVAAGVAKGAVTVNGKLWDIAAPAAIVLEAGGLVTDLSGKPIFPFELREYCGAKVPFLAAGPAAHGQLLSEIRSLP